MSSLDRIQVMALGDSAKELAEGAAAAEAAGIEGIWAIELYRSTITQATWLASQTESIGIGTGITWAFTRSPFLLAVSALDIDEMSGGRFRLGLGAGVKRLNERWHGVEYGRPAPHLRETVEATRLIMESANAGAPIRYEGTYHDIDIKGWTRPHPAQRDKVPIYVAAVGEGMARMAGDVADGALGHLICSTRWLEEVMVPNIEKGLARSGRERSSFDFIPGMCVGDRERRLGGRGGVRRSAKDARLLRDGAHLRARVRARRVRIRGRGCRQRVPGRRSGRRRSRGHRRDGRRLLRRRNDRQGAR